jgi:salicylate hydroxylase
VRVIIVGGGIGGVTAAIALEQRGIDVALYERATALTEVGAGVSLWPNEKGSLVTDARDLGAQRSRRLLCGWWRPVWREWL